MLNTIEFQQEITSESFYHKLNGNEVNISHLLECVCICVCACVCVRVCVCVCKCVCMCVYV